MKHNLIPLVLLTTIAIGCSKNQAPDQMSPSANGEMVYYDMSRGLVSARLFENTPVINRFTSQPYTFVDKYEDKYGVAHTDTVKGQGPTDKGFTYGSYDLSLYGEGITLNTDSTFEGKGTVVTLHLASPDTTRLRKGTYTFSQLPDPNTFTANLMLSYSSEDRITGIGTPTTPANVSSGKVSIDYPTDSTIHVAFDMKTSIGTIAKGVYNGVYKHVVKRHPVEKQLFTGEMKKSRIAPFGWASLLSTFGYRVERGGRVLQQAGPSADLSDMGFLSLNPPGLLMGYFKRWGFAGGVYAKNNGHKLTDWQMVLTYDLETKKIEIKSPIEISAFLWHNRDYDLPNRTLFMKAPASFTQADYDKISETKDIQFDMKSERLFLEPGDQQGFVFFVTAEGGKGVLRINQVTPSISDVLRRGPVTIYTQKPATVQGDFKYVRSIYSDTFAALR